jgi:hypothetical protein
MEEMKVSINWEWCVVTGDNRDFESMLFIENLNYSLMFSLQLLI